jgi:hypothetical protein
MKHLPVFFYGRVLLCEHEEGGRMKKVHGRRAELDRLSMIF